MGAEDEQHGEPDGDKQGEDEEFYDAISDPEKLNQEPDAEMKAEEPDDAGDEGRQGELEEDAPEDPRPKVTPEQVYLNMTESTPNVMPFAGGKLLGTLCDSGCQYFLAGVKASVGVKAGRYMFEAKIVEILNPYEGQAHRQGKTPLPKQVVRLGFALASSGPILDDGDDKCYFDSEGNFVHKQRRQRVAQPFRREQLVAVVLNLDKNSKNTNTVSLFRNGSRLCSPQPLPESLIGKPLFPTITWKNMTLQVNWGPKAKLPLPFRCLTLAEAAAEDVEPAKQSRDKDTKPEVLFPLGLPDQGVFDWLDLFLEENPHYWELSDRKVLKWAAASGLFRDKGFEWRSANDKPGMNFGIGMLDDHSLQKVLMSVAPTLRRDIVCMELNANLQASERAKALRRFPASDFKRVAVVAMGEPPAKYKEKALALMLADKVAAAEHAKQLQLEESSRRRNEGRNRWRGEEEQEVNEEKGDEANAEGDEEKAGSEKPTADKPIELTEEEKALWHRKMPASDLTPSQLGKCFAYYSIPKKEEGFDEIRYAWQGHEKCNDLLKDWVMDQKRTQRVEDLEPSTWFKDKYAEWQKVVQEWRRNQSDSKDSNRRKRPGDRKERRRDEDGEEAEGGAEPEPAEDKGQAADIDEEDVDVMTVADINDIGNGKPIYANFAFEDWTLLSLRYEFHLLVYAFQHDVGDPDRPAFHESHLPFYYTRYFNKAFSLKYFGIETTAELCALIKDSAKVNEETNFLEAVQPLDTPLEKFMRYTEEHRRERQRNIDAGDETANLKFTRPAPPPPRQSQMQSHGGPPDRRGGGNYQRSSGGSRGPPPPIGRSGAPRGSGGGGGRYGAPPPPRGGYDGPVGRSREPLGGSKRPHTPPPPSPSYGGYPPSKHHRSSYSGGGGGYSRGYR